MKGRLIIEPLEGDPGESTTIPSGIALDEAGDPFLVSPEDPRARAVIARDQEVWLFQPGILGETSVDEDPLVEEIPMATGMILAIEERFFRAEPGPDSVRLVEVEGAEEETFEGPTRRPFRWVLLIIVLLLGTLGGGAYWFSLKLPVPVELNIQPEPSGIAIDGDPWEDRTTPLKLSPGRHRIEATLPGYHLLSEVVMVTRERENAFTFSMEPLPGILRVTTNVPEAQVLIDGKPSAEEGQRIFDLEAGIYLVRVEAGERFLPFEDQVRVRDKREETLLEADLKPNWGTVRLRTEPKGARIFDARTGELLGVTPETVEFLPGIYKVRLEIAGGEYAPGYREFEIVPGAELVPPIHQFAAVPGTVAVTTNPEGATVLVNGRAVEGVTPLEASVRPGEDVEISLLLEGFNQAIRTVDVASGESVRVDVGLEALLGRIMIKTDPPGSAISINGQSRGFTPFDGNLPARMQEVTLRKEGFATQTVRVTPIPNDTVERTVEMVPLKGTPRARAVAAEAAAKGLPETITGPHGGEMVLIRPESFRMGSPEDEGGRDSDESPVAVEKISPFYVSVTETTNAMYREYKPNHDSGSVGRYTLDTGDRPVVQVSWPDATGYADWLSGKAGIGTVYRGGDLRAGFRLPTEAEFEYLLRMDTGADPFPWGDYLPPPGGNFADIAAGRELGRVMKGYADDGTVASIYVASSRPNSKGVYELSDNVAEWTHDTYRASRDGAYGTINPVTEGAGPKVIKGGSYRTDDPFDLRSAARRPGNAAADDLGFRLVLPVEAYRAWKGGGI